MKSSTGILLLVVALGGPASTAHAAPQGRTSDSYFLARGSMSMMNGSFDELQDVRTRYATPFLWFRRNGHAYVIRDTKLIDEADTLFSPVRQLDDEQAALDARESALDREDEALDAEQDRLEERSDDISEDVGDDEATVAQSTELAALARQQSELAPRQADLARRQRALEREERALEQKEEALEAAAEADLWTIMDRAIQSGAAAPAEGR